MKTKQIRQLAAVMFTDIVGYTRMMHEDELATLQKVNKHRSVLKDCTGQFNGRILQYYGDASLSIYNSAVEAIRCAQQMQAAYRESPQVPLRIGLHIGEIVFQDDDIYGDAINVASRIESLGIANSILISERIYAEIKNHPEFPAKNLGHFNLKNLKEPVGVYALSSGKLAVPDRLEINQLRDRSMDHQPAKDTKSKGLLRGFLLLSAFIMTIILSIPTFGTYFKNLFADESPAVLKKERVIVWTFENRTMQKELDVIGKMSSDWISQGLIETEIAKVILPGNDGNQEEEYNTASLGPDFDWNDFSKSSGARLLIDGSYYIQEDSIFVMAKLSDIQNGEIIYTFPVQASPVERPLEALENMKKRICGYWVSQEKEKPNFSIPPLYDAYKEYITAKEYWSKDYEKALFHINRAIDMDTTFINAYLLKISLLQNTRKTEEAIQLCNSLEDRLPTLNSYQANLLLLYKAKLDGKNQLVYKYFKPTYEQNPKDIFHNTSMAVFALEYVNRPKETLDILDNIDHSKLDFGSCKYCFQQIHFMARAYIELGNYKKALDAIYQIPGTEHDRRCREFEIRALARMGKVEKVRQLLKEVDTRQLEKDYRYLYYTAAREFQMVGEAEATQEFGREALQLYSDSTLRPNVHMQALTLYTLGRYDEAQLAFQKLWDKAKSTRLYLTRLGTIYALKGDRDAALNVVAQLEEFSKTATFDYGYLPYQQARIFALLGDKEQAVAKLKRSLQEGRKFGPYDFQNDTDFKSLLDYPPFQEIIKLKTKL